MRFGGMQRKAYARNLLRKASRYLGYEIVQARPASSLSLLISSMIGKFDINCMLDVGGHHGEHGLFARETGYAKHIVSFEPDSSSFRRLQAVASGDRFWRTHKLALGSYDGTGSMNVTKATILNSFLKPSNYGLQEYGQGLEVDHAEQVDVRRLDTIFHDYTGHIRQPRVYLKMDTQGWDLEVLKGAGETLPLISVIQSELSVRSVYDGMPAYTESMRFMNELGFDLVGMFPVSWDKDMRVIEFDCLMLNRAHTR